MIIGTKATLIERIVKARSESEPERVQQKSQGEKAADSIATERYGKMINALNGAELRDMLKLAGSAAGEASAIKQAMMFT